MKGRKSKRKYILALLALLIVSISVGYAALGTTLDITGTTTIKNQSWDVHFENVSPATGSVTPTAAANIVSNTTLTYEVTLEKPGDFYEFTVDVKNAGSIAAKLEATPTIDGVSSEQDVYTNYKVTYSDGTAIGADDELDAGQTKTIKVRVEYDKNISNNQLPTETQTLNLTFAMNYIQA